LNAWVQTARPFNEVYFRSVSFQYCLPKQVVDGKGTERTGNRFASKGTLAVYLSESEAVALAETTHRKNRLGGDALISIDKYPRITYAVQTQIDRVIQLNDVPVELADFKTEWLDEDTLEASQKLGDHLLTQGVQGLIWPSVTRTGLNLIVYLKHAGPKPFKIINDIDFLETLKAGIT
jgi:RES domain-containing protein